MKNNLKYFLAANSSSGFVSCFEDCYSAKEGWRNYIIKGGPGTGKSSFMKYMAKRADEKGIRAELIPCSSDPNSLDAVIFPDKKIVIMDGTAPHTVDPKYPAVCEQILNFGDFWDSDKFLGQQEYIIALTDKNKLLHKRAACYLKAVGQFIIDNFKIADASTDKERISSFARRLCRKRIPPKNNSPYGKEKIRFLSGITPNGVISFSDTVTALCKNTVIISDEYGSASNTIMRQIREYALGSGYEVITVKNAFLPEALIDGVILPELSLGFIRENEYFTVNTDIRRIHARRFVHAEQMAKSRKRIKFNKKTADNLLRAAVETLGEAKRVHDELEKYYIKAMDFEALGEFAKEFTDKLFK